MAWEVEFYDAFEAQYLAFEQTVQGALLAVAKLMAEYAPQLGRPHAGRLKGSKRVIKKELRFEPSDGEWRAAFVFDLERRNPVGSRRQVRRKPETLLPPAYRQSGFPVFRTCGKPESRKEGKVRWAGT